MSFDNPYSSYPGNPVGAPKLSTLATSPSSGHPGKLGFCFIGSITGPTADPVNGATDDWTPISTSQGTANYRCGPGWEVWRDALIRRGRPASEIVVEMGSVGMTVKFVADTALHFISLHKRAIVLHAFPPKVLARIRGFASHPMELGFWCMSDRLTTGPMYSGWNEVYRTAALPFLLQGSAKAGCSNAVDVDPEEPDAWPGGICRHYNPGPHDESPRPGDTSGHSWQIDYRSAGYKDAIVQATVNDRVNYWNLGPAGGQWDFYHSDNCLPQYLPGDATNEPAITDTDWKNGINAVGAAFAAALPQLRRPFSGNIGDMLYTPDMVNVHRQIIENPFLLGDGSRYHTEQEVKTGLLAVKNGGHECFLQGKRLTATSPLRIPELEDRGFGNMKEYLHFCRQQGIVERVFTGISPDGDKNSTTAILHFNPEVHEPLK